MQRKLKQGDEGAGTRRRILEALRLHGPLTAGELAEKLGGGSVAMRVHMRNLHAAGLVAHTEERKALGRPVRRFRLTPAADSLFPKYYDLLAIKLLETITNELSERTLQKILKLWEDELHVYFNQLLPEEPAARLKALAEHQTDYGFMASVQRDQGGNALLERNCPIAQVAARYPVICDHERALYQRLLGHKVSLRACQARGDTVCIFSLDESTIPRAAAS